MPMVWHKRFAAFWWLLEYCAIQSFQERPKNMAFFLSTCCTWILPYKEGGPDCVCTTCVCGTITGSSGMMIHAITYPINPIPPLATPSTSQTRRTSVTSTSRCRANPMHTPATLRPSRARSNGCRATRAPNCRPHAEQYNASSGIVRPQKLQYIEPPNWPPQDNSSASASRNEKTSEKVPMPISLLLIRTIRFAKKFARDLSLRRGVILRDHCLILLHGLITLPQQIIHLSGGQL